MMERVKGQWYQKFPQVSAFLQIFTFDLAYIQKNDNYPASEH